MIPLAILENKMDSSLCVYLNIVKSSILMDWSNVRIMLIALSCIASQNIYSFYFTNAICQVQSTQVVNNIVINRSPATKCSFHYVLNATDAQQKSTLANLTKCFIIPQR